MINGVHVLFYTKNPEADRAFVRDVLQFPSIDIGRDRQRTRLTDHLRQTDECLRDVLKDLSERD